MQITSGCGSHYLSVTGGLQTAPAWGRGAGTDCLAPFSSPSTPARAPDSNRIWFTLALFGSNHLTSCYYIWVPQPPLPCVETAPSPYPAFRKSCTVGSPTALHLHHKRKASSPRPPNVPSGPLMCLLVIPSAWGAPGSGSTHPHPSGSGPGLAQTSKNPLIPSTWSPSPPGEALRVRHSKRRCVYLKGVSLQKKKS